MKIVARMLVLAAALGMGMQSFNLPIPSPIPGINLPIPSPVPGANLG